MNSNFTQDKIIRIKKRIPKNIKAPIKRKRIPPYNLFTKVIRQGHSDTHVYVITQCVYALRIYSIHEYYVHAFTPTYLYIYIYIYIYIYAYIYMYT